MTGDQIDLTRNDVANHLRAAGEALEHALEIFPYSSRNEIASAIIDVELAYEVASKLATVLHARRGWESEEVTTNRAHCRTKPPRPQSRDRPGATRRTVRIMAGPEPSPVITVETFSGAPCTDRRQAIRAE